MDKEKLDFLCSNMNEISISVDGIKEVNDLSGSYKNGHDIFEDIIGHLHYLIKKDIDSRVRMTVTPPTKDILYDNIVYFIEKGVMTISPSIDFHNNVWVQDYLQVLTKQLKNIASFLFEHPCHEDITVVMIIYEETIIRKKVYAVVENLLSMFILTVIYFLML